MVGGTCHALPSRETIQEIIYQNQQNNFRTHIIYELLKREFIEEYGEEEWKNFMLEAGDEQKRNTP